MKCCSTVNDGINNFFMLYIALLFLYNRKLNGFKVWERIKILKIQNGAYDPL